MRAYSIDLVRKELPARLKFSEPRGHFGCAAATTAHLLEKTHFCLTRPAQAVEFGVNGDISPKRVQDGNDEIQCLQLVPVTLDHKPECPITRHR
jgi:hypothetical protein